MSLERDEKPRSRISRADFKNIVLAGVAGGVAGALLQNEMSQIGWGDRSIEFSSDKSYKILALTDIHAAPFDMPPRQESSRAEEALTTALTILGNVPFDMYAQLGDAITGDPYDYKENLQQLASIHALFSGLPFPGFHVLGNHEAWRIPQEFLYEFYKQRNLPLYGSMDCKTFKAIWIPVDAIPDETGFVPDEVLTWLSEDIKYDTPYVLCIHYPIGKLDLTGNPYYQKDPTRATISNWEQMLQVLAKAPPQAIIAGHEHWLRSSMVNNIRIVTLPSFTENKGNVFSHPSVYTILEFSDAAEKIRVATYERDRCFSQLSI